MSDRRSFSEIPAEVLRDHGEDARVERIWGRLHADLGPVRARGSGRSVTAALGIAAVAFALGILVGGRFDRRSEVTAQVADLGAEPVARAAPAAPAPAARPAAEVARRTTPRAVVGRQGRGVPAAPEVVPSPAPPEEAALPILPTPPAEWRRLADDGEYDRALAALEAAGGFDAPMLSATAEELMSLVDVARATGQRERAVAVLRRIVSAHGADPNAPVAAWMLGNELAKVGDRTGAEQAFAMYRALSPGGDFAEDALARQVDMAVEERNVEHARKLASQYLKEFPDGPRHAEFQAQVDAWAESQASPAGSSQRSGSSEREESPGARSLDPDGGVPR